MSRRAASLLTDMLLAFAVGSVLLCALVVSAVARSMLSLGRDMAYAPLCVDLP